MQLNSIKVSVQLKSLPVNFLVEKLFSYVRTFRTRGDRWTFKNADNNFCCYRYKKKKKAKIKREFRDFVAERKN